MKKFHTEYDSEKVYSALLIKTGEMISSDPEDTYYGDVEKESFKLRLSFRCRSLWRGFRITPVAVAKYKSNEKTGGTEIILHTRPHFPGLVFCMFILLIFLSLGFNSFIFICVFFISISMVTDYFSEKKKLLDVIKKDLGIEIDRSVNKERNDLNKA